MVWIFVLGQEVLRTNAAALVGDVNKIRTMRRADPGGVTAAVTKGDQQRGVYLDNKNPRFGTYGVERGAN
jgi:hypothetical protein